MNNRFTDQKNYRHINMAQQDTYDHNDYDRDYQNLKKGFEIFDSQRSQQIQGLDHKMAAFEGMQSGSFDNDIGQNLPSCPFAQIDASQKQNPLRTQGQADQNVRDSKFNCLDEHQIFGICQKRSALDIGKQIQQNTTTSQNLQPHQISLTHDTLPHQSFYNQTNEMDKRFQSQIMEQMNVVEVKEMAPNLNDNKQFKEQQLRPYHQTQGFSHLLQYQQPSAMFLEQNNRVNMIYNQGRDDQYHTPTKQQFQSPLQGQVHSMTDLKYQNSSKKADIKNLQALRVQFINSKSSKSKTLVYNDPISKRSQNSGKSAKIGILKNQSSSQDKKISIQMNESDQKKRMIKKENKKKNPSKIETQTEEKTIDTETIKTFRSRLSYQAYEMTHLNQLSDFNQKVKQQRLQTISLKGNMDRISYDEVPRNHFSQHNFIRPTAHFEEHTDDKKRTRALQIKGFSIENLSRNRSLQFNRSIGQKNVAFEEVKDTNQVVDDIELDREDYFSEEQRSPQDKKVKCSCPKNNCASGYCDCLKKFEACDPSVCLCVGCINTKSNVTLRFKKKNDKQQKQGPVKVGCNCKNSQCNKNYCECFQDGNACNPQCKCLDCKNKLKTE